MKSRKGSLSLSVNAIVVLIIAITMLGLGLGFVRMMFTGAVDKFQGILSEEQDPEIPGASNPITLSRGALTAKPGQDVALKIAFYNPTNGDWNKVKPIITCSPSNFNITVNEKKILRGKYVIFGALIKVLGSQVEGSHLCGIEFNIRTIRIAHYLPHITIS